MTSEPAAMLHINQPTELESALRESEQHPVFIFKHSTACPVSSGAYERVTDFLERAPAGTPPFYMVRVIEARPISNQVAQDLEVRHESPQLILVHNRKAEWSTSHHKIRAESIKDALEKTA